MVLSSSVSRRSLPTDRLRARRSTGPTGVRIEDTTVDCRLLGWPEDSPRIDLDHERFAYAGNFRTGRTGIAVVREESAGAPGEPADAGTDSTKEGTDSTGTGTDLRDVEERSSGVIAAVSFDPDRAVDAALRVRYVTVREDRRGEGIGPRLLAFLVERALDREYEVVRIGVNNPIAYCACYTAGFGFTGEQSGMGELVLQSPPPAEPDSADGAEHYRDGLEQFAARDLPQAQERVLERHRGGEPPVPKRSWN